MAPIDSRVSVGCVEVSDFIRDDVVICAERDTQPMSSGQWVCRC